MKRVAVFIDGNNFYFGLRKIYGRNKSLKSFDFEEFANYLARNEKVASIYYYNAQLDKKQDLSKFKSQKEFFTALREIPNFNLILCKLLKRNITGTNKHYYIIKEDDIHMEVDMVDGAVDDTFDTDVLGSGDGAFVPAVRSVQRRNRKIQDVCFHRSSSRSLKNHCDKSVALAQEILNEFFMN